MKAIVRHRTEITVIPKDIVLTLSLPEAALLGNLIGHTSMVSYGNLLSENGTIFSDGGQGARLYDIYEPLREALELAGQLVGDE